MLDLLSKKFCVGLLTISLFSLLTACGQNPAVLNSDSGSGGSGSGVSLTPGNSSSDGNISTPSKGVWVGDQDSDPGFSDKDRDQLKDTPFPYFNTDQKDKAARPVMYPPYTTAKGNGYSRRSNSYFRVWYKLPPRETVKAILEAVLEIQVRKYIAKDEVPSLGREILCLLDTMACSGAYDNDLVNQNPAFKSRAQVVSELFAQIPLANQVETLADGSRIMDTNLVRIPLSTLFSEPDLFELLYNKSAPTQDPNIRKLRFVIANNALAQSAAIRIRFEMYPDKVAGAEDTVSKGPGLDPADQVAEPRKCPDVDSKPSDPGNVDIIANLDGRVLHFATDSATLNTDGKIRLRKLAHLLSKYSYQHVKVVGHTDKTGPYQHNMELSLRRAASVSVALKKAGMPADKLIIDGKGPNEPRDDRDTREAYATNRRVEITIQGVPANIAEELKAKIKEIWPNLM